MKLKILQIIFLVFIANANVACSQTYPTTVGTNKIYDGYIVDGKKFGVKIGDTKTEVRKKLTNQGKIFVENKFCYSDGEYIFACKKGNDIDIFRVKDLFFDGSIFIRYENGRVNAIIWRAKIVYIDF